MTYVTIFLGIQDIILSIIVLTVFGLLIFGLLVFSKREIKKQKSDKYLLINDMVKYDKLVQLITYRIDNTQKDLYFSLMLVSIDQFDQIKSLVNEEGIKEFLYKIKTYVRMNLPKGAKMALLDSQDTFLVYLPEIYEEKDFFKLAEAFKNSLEKKVTVLKNINIKKTTSLALAYFPHDGNTYDEVFSNLNKALINVKKMGGNAIALYQEEMKKTDNYYNAYTHLIQAINDKNLFIGYKNVYSPSINKKIGSSSYLYLKEESNLLSYGMLHKTLEATNDDLWVGLYYFEKNIVDNLRTLQEMGAKPFYILMQNSLKMYEHVELYGSYIDLVNKYKIDVSKFVFEIIDKIDIEKDQQGIKNIWRFLDLGFKFAIEITELNDETNRLLEVIDFPVIKIEAKNLTKEMVLKLNSKMLYVYNVNTAEEDQLVKEMNVELAEGTFYLQE